MKTQSCAVLLAAIAFPAIAGEKSIPAETTPKDWCGWLADEPGEFHKDKNNPWIDEIQVSGRLQWQAGHVSGEDVRGQHFSDSFDDFRRARLETEIGFLKFFDAEISVNLVDDRRFRAEEPNDLDWGYDTFDSAILSFDAGKAFGTGPFDKIKAHYGRMKLCITEEVHTSSKEIITIERSAIADKLGGEQNRPTGATLELEKGPWSGTFGIFSGEDDSDFIGAWNDGEFYYASIAWQANEQFLLRLDHAHNHQSGSDDALGYDHSTSLAATYQKEQWGLLVNFFAGDNGDFELNPERQGDFHGAVAMPWYWLLENRLQLVGRYQYVRAEETEGTRLVSRYIGAQHLPPTVDLDNGYGDEHHSFYLGLNYYLCGHNAKIMGGVSYDRMSARTDDVEAMTYLVALRSYF